MNAYSFGWSHIVRLGMVQAALAAVIVLMTSTLNRIMVVELTLPAIVPGILVALHYLVQVSRPRLGHGSDQGARRTPWIIGGMTMLTAGALCATLATLWMSNFPVWGVLLSGAGFVMIGLGGGAAGTSLLVLLARRVDAEQRVAAAIVVWLMMIAGFAFTSRIADSLLAPYSPTRLMAMTVAVCTLALIITLLSLFRLETDPGDPVAQIEDSQIATFSTALSEVWQESLTRHFTLFIFISMLAYSAQDLILEPFAANVFGFTPDESASLAGVQHGGVLVGMLLLAVGALFANKFAKGRIGSLRMWCFGGCLASAFMLTGLVLGAHMGSPWPLKTNLFLVGAANGALSIAAIGLMMRLVTEGRSAREGVRMGLWGAAQAIAFGFGGLLGVAASELAHWLIPSSGFAYGIVFALEAVLFVIAALRVLRIVIPAQPPAHNTQGLEQASFL